jgi:membrane associated rhomboid family serine protease
MRPVTERLSPTITALIVISTVAFALYAVVPPSRAFIHEHLALGEAVWRRVELWQLVTSLFFHLDGITFIFGMIGLWFVGAAMEREIGRARFLVLFFVSGILANLAIAAVVVAAGPGRAVRRVQHGRAGAVRGLRPGLQPHPGAACWAAWSWKRVP